MNDPRTDGSEAFIGARGEGCPSLWRRVARNTWPLLSIPIVLTGLFVAIQRRFDAGALLGTLLVNTIISAAIGLAIMSGYLLVSGRLIRRTRSRIVRKLLHAVTLFGGLAAGAWIAVFFFRHAPGLGRSNIHVGDILGVGAVIVAVVWAVEETMDSLRRRAHEQELRAEQARREALRAQLDALQARTDPHFLFNGLNTVAGLIQEDPDRAERVLVRLSDLFRYALDGGRRERVPLADELEIVRGYLEVEGLRLGGRLRSRVEEDDGVGTATVPPLILQPLVENAVLHGVAPREEGGSIVVRATRENGRLALSVEDDGPGPGGSSHAGAGSALETLRSRLALLYGAGATLTTGRGPAGGYAVRMTLPLDAEPNR